MERESLARKIVKQVAELNVVRLEGSDLIPFWLSYIKEGDPDVAVDAIIDFVISNEVYIDNLLFDNIVVYVDEYLPEMRSSVEFLASLRLR